MIKVYSKPNCIYCEKAKKLLEDNNIEYENINLALKENRAARAHYRSLGIEILPVIEGDDWRFIGFDGLKEKLGIKNE